MEYSHFVHYGGRGFRSCLDDTILAWREGGSENTDNTANDNADDINGTVSVNKSEGGGPVAVVDYAAFKKHLRDFSQRRTKLLRLLDHRKSDAWIEDDVGNILGEDPAAASPPATIGGAESSRTAGDPAAFRGTLGLRRARRRLPAMLPRAASWSPPGDCYVSMDDGYCGPDLPGIFRNNGNDTSSSTPPRWLLRNGDVMREVSGLERESVAEFLADQTSPISKAYLSRTRRCSRKLTEWRTTLWYEHDRWRLRQPRRGSETTAAVTTPATLRLTTGRYYKVKDNNENNDNNNTSNQKNDNNIDRIEKSPAEPASETTMAMIRQTLVLGKALLDLEAFCILNILVVRQTLIRYDAFARSFEGTPLMDFYLKTVLRSTTPRGKRKSRRSAGNAPDRGGGTSGGGVIDDDAAPDLYHHELRQILLHREVTYLCDTFARHLFWLGGDERRSDGGVVATPTEPPPPANEKMAWTGMGPVLQTVASRFQTDREELRALLVSSSSSSAVAGATRSAGTFSRAQQAPAHEPPRSIATMAETFLGSLGRYVLHGMHMEDQFGWYVDGTMNRGRSLTTEMRSLGRWKRLTQRRWSLALRGMTTGGLLEGWDAMNPEAGLFGSAEERKSLGERLLEGFECDNLAGCGTEEDAFKSDNSVIVPPTGHDSSSSGYSDSNRSPPVGTVSMQQKFNLFMALAGGFLYCMNYYIVEPSSTMYVNALGAHDAAGATLIGMMPIASFLAAIVYSVWTNEVFRKPFLVSCTLMVTGNLVYSSAFRYRSLSMALTGRFLTGLGGPKMIVRRYMADTTSVGIRTSVNALFGMVVAAGSALGPGCAILLSRFEFSVMLPDGSELWFNSMTGPGWFMAALWGIFAIVLFVGFREQDRIGLAEKLEQDAMEQLQQQQQQRSFKLRDDDDDDDDDRDQDKSSSRTNLEESPGECDAGPAPGSDPITRDNPQTGNAISWKSNQPRSDPTIVHVPTNKPLSSSQDDSVRNIVATKSSMSMMSECYNSREKIIVLRGASSPLSNKSDRPTTKLTLSDELQKVSQNLLFPVRICLGLLFAKVFVIEMLVSCTSVLSKNRYGWTIDQVGLLGCANGLSVIPLSILVGRLSLHHQDRFLMVWLLSVGMAGLCLLVDLADLLGEEDPSSFMTYHKNSSLGVGPVRYVVGYFVTYLSIQSFEGIIGSALSKLIPTALAEGTFNSGLLATLVDTFGRSCGDLFISLMGFWNIRQLMNLLFIPGVLVLATCLLVVRRYYDLLAV